MQRVHIAIIKDNNTAPTVLTITDNPTNGDVIKALFPNIRFSTSTEDTIAKAFIRPNGSVVINDYCDDWWNAPYKGAESEDNNDTD